MTLEQFDCQYSWQKPYYEYWFGEPVQKAMPTWIHSVLQKIIIRLLDDAGLESGAEVKLKISQEFQPLPDIVAVKPGGIELPYPTHPVELVIEILSPDDPFSRVLSKCQFYSDLGIQNIYIVDPEPREVWRWIKDRPPAQVQSIMAVSVEAIWAELDRRLKPGEPLL